MRPSRSMIASSDSPSVSARNCGAVASAARNWRKRPALDQGQGPQRLLTPHQLAQQAAWRRATLDLVAAGPDLPRLARHPEPGIQQQRRDVDARLCDYVGHATGTGPWVRSRRRPTRPPAPAAAPATTAAANEAAPQATTRISRKRRTGLGSPEVIDETMIIERMQTPLNGLGPLAPSGRDPCRRCRTAPIRSCMAS